jgi:hypothetical protein
MSSHRGKWEMGGRGSAQVIEPLQAKSARVELDQRRESCRQGPGRPWVAASGEADLRPTERTLTHIQLSERPTSN